MTTDSEDVWDTIPAEPAWKELIGHPAWLGEDPRDSGFTLRAPEYPVEKLSWTVGTHLWSAYRSKGEIIAGKRYRKLNDAARRSGDQLQRIFLTRYLLGVPAAQLADELEDLRAFFRPLIVSPDHMERTWFGAFAVLFGNAEALEWAIKPRLNEGYFLYDAYLRRSPLSTGFVWKERHRGLLEAVELQLAGDTEAASKRVFDYVDSEWYDENEGVFWHDARDLKMGGFYGYWCFEVAAINVIYGIDDSALRDHRYYPTDLVDYHRQSVSPSLG